MGKAANRQTVKYADLRTLMGYTDDRPLGVILGCIMFYCEQNDLPSLTSIVVNSQGTPGPGFTAVPPAKLKKANEEVFEFPWYEYTVPTVEDFHEARLEAVA